MKFWKRNLWCISSLVVSVLDLNQPPNRRTVTRQPFNHLTSMIKPTEFETRMKPKDIKNNNLRNMNTNSIFVVLRNTWLNQMKARGANLYMKNKYGECLGTATNYNQWYFRVRARECRVRKPNVSHISLGDDVPRTRLSKSIICESGKMDICKDARRQTIDGRLVKVASLSMA